LKYLFDAAGLAVPFQTNQMINALPMHSNFLAASTHENHAVMSGDGRVAVFYSLGNIQHLNPNGLDTIYRTNLSTGKSEVVAQGSIGTPWGISVSYDGATVVYGSGVPYQIYVANYGNATPVKLSSIFPNGAACADYGFGQWPLISADGKTITFKTYCPTLLSSPSLVDAEIVQINLGTLKVRQVSQQVINGAPVSSNGFNGTYDVSFNGEFVVFESEATNILPPTSQINGSN
jgi:hypothetical protein